MRGFGGPAALALVMAVAGAGRAAADPVAPASMVAGLDVFVDAVVAGRAEALACAPKDSPARDEAAWKQGAAIFVATLWANGYPADFINGVRQRLAAPPSAAPVTCAAPDAPNNFGTADHEGWVSALELPLKGLDLTLIENPASDEQWAAAKKAIADELPTQKQLLECAALAMPELMPVLTHDWDQMIVRLGGDLVAAGVARDEITAALSPAEANALWHRAAPEVAAALRASCAADQAWMTRFQEFTFLSLKDRVEKLLPAPPADDGDGN